MLKFVAAVPRWVKWGVVLLALLSAMSASVTFTSSPARAADPAQGPGGPILVITSGNTNFAPFYSEILRTEGFNAFTVIDISAVTPATLAAHDVVLLAKMTLPPAQVAVLTDWVTAGGNLIAMAPDAQLAGLLGITPVGTTLSDGYLLVDTVNAPGAGIVSQTMQFHGSAALYTLNGAARLATLYSNATTATAYPALTLHSVGSGRAAAFAYDLATSVVQTRQGNPAWAAQERDGFSPIRSNDKFYGNRAGDSQADWVDLTKVAIPQADEQQRWLANLILTMNASRKPLPRFWYFPNGKKAVVIMTGDDHGNGGTAGRFDQFRAASPVGCSVANWECVRGTSYMYTNTPISDAQAAQYNADGFEIALHVDTGCNNYTASSLEEDYVTQLAAWRSKFTSLPPTATQRHHCIVWSDWTSGAEVEFNHGMRLDTTYYFWPSAWLNDTPGVFTGSAMPMRFSRLDGRLVDVYQATTQMTDESGQTFPFTVNTLLDRALGAEGYYGAYTMNAHTDFAVLAEADAVVSSAQARGVPIVSSRQMLNWLDARNSSSFGALAWNAGSLSFSVSRAAGANGLQAMLPVRSADRVLAGLSRGGVNVPYTTSVIKGIEYAFFAADAGAYVANYGAVATGPVVVATSPSSGAIGVPVSTRASVTFSTDMDAASLNAATFELRNAANTVVAASVSYDATSRVATLIPSTALVAGSSYTATLHGGATDPRVKDASGNALASDASWAFTTAVDAAACPCGAWSATTVPGTASDSDTGSVELGVRFRSDVDGYVSGVRFYKGSANTGTHIGNLWSAAGTRLATATFTNETTSGWQQVNFATPVAVTANTVYVASYYAPNGRYSADVGYFALTGIDKPPVHLLRDGVSGANGVYAYGPSSSFPSATYRSTNYWVDVVFNTTAPADTTAPTVTATTPANGALGVASSTVIGATLSEALDATTVDSSTFELRTAANALVGGAVSYNAATRQASFTPAAALLASTTYTATLRGGATDPRIKDTAGNALAQSLSWSFTTAAAGGGGGGGSSCTTPANDVAAENCLVGNAASEWDITGAGDASIQGFATQISVNRGNPVTFKVNTNASSYRFDIYRLGYYGGLGARKVASVNPSASLPQSQPACLNDVATGLIDCGNWANSGSWTVPADAVSGIYVAKVIRADTLGASHIVFVVRNDASTSSLLFQTSDTTWQAYNNYGGNSLYAGSPVGRAYKVSYNRPFNTRAVDGGQDWLFNSEYPMLRWLESNGYDVSYSSGIDTDRYAGLLLNHRVFVSVGHDEYWSAAQRANVEAARNAGVNLAFFSGNEIFWKTRWENSIDGSGTPYRTLVSYKETLANAKIDPSAAWTGTWRDPRFSPPADGGRPENALTGTIFMVNAGATTALVVPAADGKMRFWRNTSVASLAAGTSATLAANTLGYEWDVDADNGSRPAGLVRLSTTTVANAPVLQDYGGSYASGTATHNLTLYRHASGARVFGAGTVQWAWGLDATHDRGSAPADVRMQQATVNLLADMNAQPATLRPGLVAATASSDTAAPISNVTSPAAGATVAPNSNLTISGTATDSGGGVVGGVEVSVDGGASWHPATGRSSWTYAWRTPAAGTVTVKTRAVDDSGLLEVPGAGVTITVSGSVPPAACPCTIWPAQTVPSVVSDSDTASVNLGVKFTSDSAGTITGLRFYKGTANTGTHVGTLWSASGAVLAQATFTGETASGWQQVNFATPVAITANTVYVASYLAPVGRYAADTGYFSSAGADNAPLHALRNGVSGSNGVYAYASTTTFPTRTYQATNYWVDVVFNTSTPPADTTPPTVSSVSPASAATAVSVSTPVTATFSEALNAATVSAASFTLRDAAGALVNAAVAYNATTRVATLTPAAALTAQTLYTASVSTAVRDLSGNALATGQSWSFTTAAAADITPPTVSAISPAAGATGVASTANVTATFNEAMDAATISTGSFELRDASAALVSAAVSFNATTRVATLNPTGNLLLAGAPYTARVRGGATDPRVKDLAGNALAADRVWSFSVETTAPTVSSTSPANGATGVSRTANITVTFNEAVDPATVSGSTFELRDAAGALVSAVLSLNSTGRTATLNPTSTLATLTSHTAVVHGGSTGAVVRDAAGNALAADRSWTFTTR